MVCIYKPKKGKERAFQSLLLKHWPHMASLGLMSRTRPRVWKCKEHGGRTVYLEILEWRDAYAVREAHGTPEVFELWGPMGEMLEERTFYDGVELSERVRARS